MSPLGAVLSQLTPDANQFVIDAPEAWGQGRTLYGGMIAALAHEAVKRAHADVPPLRSAQLGFVGPASGRLRFEPQVLRRGRSSTIVASDCLTEEGVATRALFVYGAARQSEVAHNHLPMPNVPTPDACGPFRKMTTSMRGFWDNFETRLAAGGRMLDLSAPKPEFAVWTRFLDPGGAEPTAALLAMADCLPPAAIVHFPKHGPISSITWSIDVMGVPTHLEQWFLLTASSEHTADGYSMQSMMMWDEAGAPLVVGRQVVAIFV